MASASVGSPPARAGCQASTGSWLTTSVERTWLRSSITSNRSLASMTLGWRQEEVVEDEKTNPGELPETTHVAAVATAERQLR